MSGLGGRRSKRYNTFWSSFFFVLVALVLGAVYYAALQVDYNWRWYMVPKYFMYEDSIEVRAEIEGDIASIKQAGGEYRVTVKGYEGEEETYVLPADGELRVDTGFSLYMGDVIGTYEKWKVGLLMDGLWLTLKVSFISIFIGIAIGLMAGLARLSPNPTFRWSAMTYIELIRGSPLLVQIFIWYFVFGTLINTLLAQQNLPQVPPLWFGVASLATFSGAYIAEIVRAGIQSIHRGQMEAARSLGMNHRQAMRYIILPQALRRILPPLAGQFISLIKDSSLLGIIAIRELTKATREAVASSLQSFELWFVCAILYLVLTFALSMFLQWVEKRTVNT